jgi:hypothetical protein
MDMDMATGGRMCASTSASINAKQWMDEGGFVIGYESV